jgi:hypothetical protein
VHSNPSVNATRRSTRALRALAFAAAPLAVALLVSMFDLSAFADAQRRPVAGDARTISIHETGSLRLVSHQGTKILHERGEASGTFHGSLTANIKISYTQATVSFTISPPGGSVSGEGVESYYVSGKNGHFTGTMYLTRGTGRFAHVRSSEVHISGLIKRAHYELTLQVTGTLHD